MNGLNSSTYYQVLQSLYIYLVSVPNASVTVGITVAFIFHSFSILKQGPGIYFSFRFLSVLPCGQQERQSPLFGRFFFFLFLLTITRSGCLTKIRWFVCIRKSQRIFCISFSRMHSGLCIYNLFVWWNLNFMHNSHWITSHTQSCLVLYALCADLLDSLIMWWNVLSLSPHNRRLLFCCVLSILALT